MGRSSGNFAPGAVLAVITLLAAPGCTSLCQWARNGFKVGPNYAEPPAPVAAEWIDQANPNINSTPEDHAWWTVFNDAELNGLIDTAYLQNLDLPAAAARIMEAPAR